MRLGQLFYAGLIVRIGTDVYSAFLLAGNISYFSYMPGYGMGVAGVLQGSGDTKNPMYSTIFGSWIIRVVESYILCFYFTFGIAGVCLVNGYRLYTPVDLFI